MKKLITALICAFAANVAIASSPVLGEKVAETKPLSMELVNYELSIRGAKSGEYMQKMQLSGVVDGRELSVTHSTTTPYIKSISVTDEGGERVVRTAMGEIATGVSAVIQTKPTGTPELYDVAVKLYYSAPAIEADGLGRIVFPPSNEYTARVKLKMGEALRVAEFAGVDIVLTLNSATRYHLN